MLCMQGQGLDWVLSSAMVICKALGFQASLKGRLQGLKGRMNRPAWVLSSAMADADGENKPRKLTKPMVLHVSVSRRHWEGCFKSSGHEYYIDLHQ